MKYRPNTDCNKENLVRTFTPKAGDQATTRKWHVIDAEGVVLGRLASHAAVLLRGKHKTTFAPHIDMGDFVIVINAEKIVLTGQKAAKKFAHHHSGFPGGMTSIVYADLINQDPTRVVEKAILGMIPKNKLGRHVGTKLKVYAGPSHPHAAQNPSAYEFTQISQIVKN
jgi:large subunit ribosomal protein L13